MAEGKPIIATYYFTVMTLNERDTKKNRLVTEDTLSVFTSQQFKDDVRDRVLFGFASHYDRRDISQKQSETYLPYFDLVIDSGRYCNVISGMKRVGDSIVLKIDIFDNEAGRKIKQLHDTGTALKVSLAMTSDPTVESHWKFYRVMGLDFTTMPAFESAQESDESFSKDSAPVFTLDMTERRK